MRGRSPGPLARFAAWLVAWLPGSILDAFVQDCLVAPGPESPYLEVLFAIGLYRLERLRHHADRIDDPVIHRSLLSGAPDVLADSLLDKWKNHGDLDRLWEPALIRTDHAADLTASVRDDVADPEDWE